MNLSEANHTFTPDVLTFCDRVTALLICNLLVGLPANVYLVWLIAVGAGGNLASELFALNLAVSEILFCISSLYTLFHFLLRMSVDIGILVLQCILHLMMMFRPIFQSCICLERYLAVVHPMVFLRFKPLRYRIMCCMVDWLLTLLYCIVPVFTLSNIQITYLLISKSLFFLMLMFYCGIHVLCVLKHPAPSDGDQDRKRRNSMKGKAFKVITITLVFTSCTHLLRVFVLGPALLDMSQQVILQVTLGSLSISIVSGFITPLLYLHRTGKLPCIEF